MNTGALFILLNKNKIYLDSYFHYAITDVHVKRKMDFFFVSSITL